MKKSMFPFLVIICLFILPFFYPETESINSSIEMEIDEISEPMDLSSSPNEWPTYRGNNQRTGNVSGPAPSEKNILWTTPLPVNQYGSSPSIKDGFVYIGGSSNVRNVFSLYENNGTIRWTSYNDGGESSPCVGAEIVYSSDVFLNKTTGKKISGSLVSFSSALLERNELFISTAKYDAITNENKWTNETGSMASPAYYQGMIYSGNELRRFACFNSSTGALIWDYEINNDCWTTPAVENDRVFYHAGSKIYCFDADPSDNIDEGVNDPGSPGYDLIWTKNIPGMESSPAVANGKVYCRNRAGDVYCLWASNGSNIWSEQGFGNTDIPSSIAYADGKIYFGALYQEKAGSESLICLDASDGTLLWFHENPGVKSGRYAASCSPAIANGCVIWATSDGKVIKFGPSEDIILPTVVEISPENEASDVELDAIITAKFSERLDPLTVTLDNMIVKNSSNELLPGSISWNDVNHQITFTPEVNFTAGEIYSITLTTGLKDISGNPLDGNYNGLADMSPIDDYTWSFTTKSLPNIKPTLELIETIPNTGYPGTDFYYSVVYFDEDNDKPEYVRIHIDGDLLGVQMDLNMSANEIFRDGVYTNGEEYIYHTILTEVGVHHFNIIASDGNDTVQTSVFNLPIVSLIPNAPPIVSDMPKFQVIEDIPKTIDLAPYLSDDYTSVKDLIITTNCTYAHIDGVNLTFNVPEGVLYLDVNITVIDGDGLEGYGRMDVNITPVNDPPQWVHIPEDTVIDEGVIFNFNIEAIDVDQNDIVTYEIDVVPASDITLDQHTGLITWNASIVGLIPNPNYILIVDVTATDGEHSIYHGFTIRVIPNPRPITRLLSPTNNSKITWHGIDLLWEIEDDGYGPVLYDVYFDKLESNVALLKSDALLSRDQDTTSAFSGELERGVTYYWTVIPEDWFSYGTCESKVFSFNVNVPPQIDQIAPQATFIGKELTINLIYQDNDPFPDPLTLSLEQCPDGMDLNSDLSMIIWTPDANQVGNHTVVVYVSDGLESATMSFEVVVTIEDIINDVDDKDSPIVLIIIVLFLIIAGLGIGVFLFITMKGRSGSEADSEYAEQIPTEE
jgi:outer membrane protein assembly factor BamB